MSISLLYVPLYHSGSSLSQGQAKVFALLEGLDSMLDDVEVYVVLEGSTLVHVTRAQSDVMLCFIVPGMSMCVYVFMSSVMRFFEISRGHAQTLNFKSYQC